jgi:photosystem II stability/assembly factor-like uncharacterized protein
VDDELVKKLIVCLAAIALVSCGSPALSSPAPSATATFATSATPTATAAGATSSPAASLSASLIPLPNAAAVAAAGNGVLWMEVGFDHLFRSLDRGETWVERSLPAANTSGSIAFVNDRDGWLLQPVPSIGQCQTQAATLWRTRDGAATWQKLDAVGLAPAQCKSSVAFVDADHGYIPTWDEAGAPKIYRTADGGQTWTASSPLADPPGFVTGPNGKTLRPDTVADFGSILFADFLAFNDASRFYVYRSTDRGATWSFASAAPVQGVGVTLVTPTRWIQVIAPSASQETTNAGASWHAFASDYQQAAPIAPQIVFGDANTGYATVRGGLSRTMDGGAHWTSLKTPGT